jgi:MFS family permease
MRPRILLLTVAAGLALADASIVTLALPEILRELDTTVEGVAAVIGVYTIVLAAVLVPAERLSRRYGARLVAAVGFAIFALSSVACALAGSLVVLLVARGVQAVGGAAGLVATFTLLVGHVDDDRTRRQLWLGAAVLSAAVGPALGGALTQLFSWQAIFIAQIPIATLAVLAALATPVPSVDIAAPTVETRAVEPPAHTHFAVRPSVALGLVSAALTAVLFLLVLLLVAGWNIDPLAAAAAVTVIPAAALAGARVGGDATVRAAVGCALVGFGTITLAFLPDANLAWTLAPQALAGFGMGLSLPALGGELLPERDSGDAARLLTLRHAGIALALVVISPIVANRLDDATHKARERGVALVLDAPLPISAKIQLAPALLAGVEEKDPRQGLRDTIAASRDSFTAPEERQAFDRLAERADDTVITAVGDAFNIAFFITGAFALIAAAVMLPRRPWPQWAPAAVVAGVVTVGAYVVAHDKLAPEPVEIADPCKPRQQPNTGGLGGFIQDAALKLLDATACRLGASREELVLALADEKEAKRFEERHGVNPRSLTDLLGGLLGGG